MPAVQSALMRTEPPAGTLTTKCSQAPLSYDVVRLTLLGPEPSSRLMVSRRAVVLQSRA